MAAKSTENSSSNFPAALLLAAWTAVLLIAFFEYRGSDVGQIGKLFANLGGGPFFGFEGFRDSLAGGLIALVILAAWFGLGAFILGFIRTGRGERHSHVLEIATCIAVGAGL